MDTFRKEYTPLNESQKKQMLDIKTKAEELEFLFNQVQANGFDPRMVSLAKTNLEQAVLWGIKAVTGVQKPVTNKA